MAKEKVMQHNGFSDIIKSKAVSSDAILFHYDSKIIPKNLCKQHGWTVSDKILLINRLFIRLSKAQDIFALLRF